jgi:hypothetical protein
MASPIPTTALFSGTRVFSVLSAVLGVGAIAASTYALTQGVLPIGPAFWLVAIIALVLGLIAHRRSSPCTVDRRLAVVGMITGTLVLTFPFWLVLLPVAMIGVPFWYWHSARDGWRWWAATSSIMLGALVIGVIGVSLMVFLLGTGDPYYNIPRWTGISVHLLDFLSFAAIAIFASGVTGLFVTRRFSSTVVTVLVGFVAVSLAWWFIVQPVHTNDETWTMSTSMFIGFGLLIAISTLTVTRLFRVSGRPANHV